ncbi:hypothetical protein Mal4_46870 [Maioricimonas rarisocia]|uniref:Uncharacterized protein n=1 Tax=Maioricimonas rarisocia TaxID=2528026 RepID=A0A517ZCZ4_9PLAN|nr:hypothetical protein [Maioricimonas rarisocia]QDU40331.1 hypothetical protein Mal4_46870 [Maioricimonas rarisocia]
MATATVASPAKVNVSSEARPAAPARGYLIGPWFDLLFVANLFWPLVLLVDWWGGSDVHDGLLFWQVFFVTTPHRWITLFLVAGDPSRMQGRPLRFGLIALIAVVGCLAVKGSTGTLACLVTLDYLWNAWHFASQHHGIARIYARKAGAMNPQTKTAAFRRLEVILFRGFILYVTARVAGWSWDWQWLTTAAQSLDIMMLAVPVTIVLMTCLPTANVTLPRLCYTASVMTLFTALLLAVHFQQRTLVLQLALASALFHAVEYLAVVTWSARSGADRADLFGRVARRWGLYLLGFVVVLGATNWMLQQGFFETWLLLNLMVAFLHYAYDGMIWKSPRKTQPASA